MRHGAEFTLAVRTGTRTGRPLVVGHLLVRADRIHDSEPARVGFVVSRAVGSAVTRNRVKRRLRELMRGYLHSLPGGSLLVVRANAAAAHVRQPDLAADLDLVIARLGHASVMPQTAIQNGTSRTATVPARLLMVPIAGYRRFVSPLLPPRCRFAPSCSEYALTAVAEHGAARGLWLAIKRIARCHPFNPGGYDPVPGRVHSAKPARS